MQRQEHARVGRSQRKGPESLDSHAGVSNAGTWEFLVRVSGHTPLPCKDTEGRQSFGPESVNPHVKVSDVGTLESPA
jgi:hypothetical protein